MNRSPRIAHTPHPRAGLAPLELTLTLPLLIMLMALMINFGVIGSWKVRTQGNAHYAAFRSLMVRTGDSNPPPDNWPNAALGSGVGNSLPTVGQLWDSDIDTAHGRADWIRGEFLPNPPNPNGNLNQPQIQVKGRLEFDDGVHTGTAAMSRNVPLLRGSTSSGRFGFSLTQEVLDNRWQYHTLGMADNIALRAFVWWDILDGDLAEIDSTIMQFYTRLIDAQNQLRPLKDRLDPLDNDIEFILYGYEPPDLYPQMGLGCSLDVNDVKLNHVLPLINAIEQSPCNTISPAFLGLYSTWICHMQRCGASDQAIAPLRDRFNDLAQLVRSQQCGPPPPFPDCPLCDPMNIPCLSQCPAPTPDANGL